MKLDTICVRGGIEADETTGAIVTPIFQTSTYKQDAPGQPRLYEYSRSGNPTRTALETALTLLEREGKHAITFATGLAAAQAIVQCINSDSHVLVCEDVYGGSGRLFSKVFADYGYTFNFVDMRDPELVAQHLTDKTRMLWLESPTNPLLQIIDIEKISKLAKECGALTVVDNTFATPVFQSPLQLGADLVVHSTTKYIGGHTDLLGGAVITKDEQLAEKLKFLQFATGATNSPFEAYLLLRSIKTLALRMRKHEENAMHIAKTLSQHEAFSEVIYSGLSSHPQHELACKQMRGHSGIISLRLHAGKEKTFTFLQKLKLFCLAESLGGVDSLVNHPETMTHASVPADRRKKLNISSNLVRLSVGIEDADDLLTDLLQALA